MPLHLRFDLPTMVHFFEVLKQWKIFRISRSFARNVLGFEIFSAKKQIMRKFAHLLLVPSNKMQQKSLSSISACTIHTWKCTSCYMQVCKQVVTNLFTSCRQVFSHYLFPVVVTSLKQAVNNLQQAWMVLSDLLQGCSYKSDTVMI
jgi:hypothetical protein